MKEIEQYHSCARLRNILQWTRKQYMQGMFCLYQFTES